MRGTNRILRALLAVGLVLALQACAEGTVDDGDSANVVLVIGTFPPIPPITTTNEEGVCVFQLPTGVSVTLVSLPKSELAESPMSDAVIDSVSVTYSWDDGLVVGPVEMSAAGLVPCDAQGTVSFLPIRYGDMTADRAGHSANVMVTFRGKLVDGTAVESLPGPPGGATLSVESCSVL